MVSFENDYLEGCHERILQRFLTENMKQEPGYGYDSYTQIAKANIREVFGAPDAEVSFLTGGTQTNQIVISSLLAQHEGVIAAETGHISVLEAGAIEFTGHKIIELVGQEGKLSAEQVEAYLTDFHSSSFKNHMVHPGMVYISYPTEYGTLYSKEEMEALHKVCKDYDIPLFVDGARLGYGLMSPACDIKIEEFINLCDIFYIGATKIGALCGEAVVFNKGLRPKHFMTIIKQNGALLAKGRLLGIQFMELFSDNLYFELSQHAIDMARLLKEAFQTKGYEVLFESFTNQQFVIMKDSKLKELQEEFKLGFWSKYDEDHTVVRIITSWATTYESIESLISKL